MLRSEKPRARQRLADVLDHPAGDHEQVDRDQRDLAAAALQHERAREQARVLALRHAVGARPAAQVVAGARRDVGLADAGAQLGGVVPTQARAASAEQSRSHPAIATPS